MATIDLGTFLEQHQALLAKAREQLEAVREPRSGRLTRESLLQAKRAELGRAKTRLDEATTARAAAIQRYDQRIEEHHLTVQRIQKELDKLEQEPDDGDASKPSGPRTPVGKIEGVGPTYRDRLEAAGILTAGQLVQLSAARLAKVLDTSEGRAETILATARTLIQS
jgi:predicted flap endonuclease-1-like 5' DNA nuclease